MTLGYAVAFLVLFALAFALLAYASPRRYQVKVARALPAAPARVWVYLADPARFPHWFPFVASCEHAGGPLSGTGQRRKLILDHEGIPGDREEEAARWEENRFLELVHLPERRAGRRVPWTDARQEFRLEVAADGTKLTAVTWFSGRGMLGRMLCLLFFRRMHERDMQLALTNLDKRLREERYPP